MGIETLTAVLTSVASVAGLGWWLSGRFRSVENVQRVMLAAHEKEDQRRHEENLERFRLVSVELARKNGGVR